MQIVGVRFKDAGKVYYFNPGNIDDSELQAGSPVIVETGRGLEYGMLVHGRREMDDARLTPPVRKMLRMASEADIAQDESNRQRENEALAVCQEKVDAHGLEMSLVDVELSFDATKIIFFFTADGRVDFRELVKDLAASLRMRIELRQIGARDEAKMISGMGICGRTLCCSTFLEDFQPVSIKTAKDQGLSLNPTKISGVCGKLMCCLKYEEETYAALMKGLPTVGDKVSTPMGEGFVLQVNILKETAKVSIRGKTPEESVSEIFTKDEIKLLERRPQCEKGCRCEHCKGHK
ncbi:MAG: stage 0 sporulation family protein [Defluviitaleaceae bacterium]|nr:stage 0 sporulation family protein [Defluviitaleaceae bacterium]